MTPYDTLLLRQLIIVNSILLAGLQASAVAGGRESVVTDYMLKLLGLDVCAGALPLH